MRRRQQSSGDDRKPTQPNRSEKEKDKKEDTTESLVGGNCVICYEGEEEEEEGPLIRPCACVDASTYHYHCIAQFIIETYDRPCNVCGQQFTDRRITRGRSHFPYFFRRHFRRGIRDIIWYNILTPLAIFALTIVIFGGGRTALYLASILAILVIGLNLNNLWQGYQVWQSERGYINFQDIDAQGHFSRGRTRVFNLALALEQKHQRELLHHQQVMNQQLVQQEMQAAINAQKQAAIDAQNQQDQVQEQEQSEDEEQFE